MSDYTICGKDSRVLQQFRTTLHAQVGLLAEGPFRATAVYKAVTARLEHPEFSWDDAYFIEQSIAPYHADGRVLIELERLLVQARMSMDRETAAFYAEMDPKPMSSDCRRDLLSRILVDTQLESQKRNRRKWLLERTCRRLVYLMLGAVAVLLWHSELAALARGAHAVAVALLARLAAWLLPGGAASAGAIAGGVAEPHRWQAAGMGQVMLFVLAAGSVGALVTVAIRMNSFFKSSRLREVEAFSSWWYLTNRMLIGAVGALAGCYLVDAQVVSVFGFNNLFNPLPVAGTETVYQFDVLKTMVVGMAFGCSEYFIPATLGKLPGTTGGKDEGAQPPSGGSGGLRGSAGHDAGGRDASHGRGAGRPTEHAVHYRSGKGAGADRDALGGSDVSRAFGESAGAGVQRPADAPDSPALQDPLDLLDRLDVAERADAGGSAGPGRADAGHPSGRSGRGNEA